MYSFWCSVHLWLWNWFRWFSSCLCSLDSFESTAPSCNFIRPNHIYSSQSQCLCISAIFTHGALWPSGNTLPCNRFRKKLKISLKVREEVFQLSIQQPMISFHFLMGNFGLHTLRHPQYKTPGPQNEFLKPFRQNHQTDRFRLKRLGFHFQR